MKLGKVYKLYDKYNAKYFENKLERFSIGLVSLECAFGYTIVESNDNLFIVLDKDLNDDVMKATLIHEMVHVDQVRRGKKMTHNKKFKSMSSKIRKSEKVKTKEID